MSHQLNSMGTEYKINLSECDFECFEKDIRGRTLDRTLKETPGFVDVKNDLYRYNESEDKANEWLATVSIETDGLLIAYYDNSGTLLTNLMWSVLDVCSRVSVEEG